MNASKRAATSAPAAVRAGRQATVRRDPAGRLLVRLSTLPAVALAAFLIVALPLILADAFHPWLTGPIAVVVAAALCWWVRRAAPLIRAPGGFTPWWAFGAIIAIAAAFGVVQGLLHSGQILVERDPASYVQFGWWLAGHGGLPVDAHREAFGGGVPGLSWDSPAFYATGSGIWPQFMVGLPALLAAAKWLAGLQAMLVLNALIGALSVLAFAGLVARLIGPRWAPLAALLLAGCFPEMLTARSAYSEPLAQLLLLSGLCLLVDCRELRGRAARAAAGSAGLLLGIGELVRVDVLRDLIPVVVVAGALAARKRVQAAPLAIGLAVGLALGIADAALLSRPYISSLRDSLLPLVAVAAAAVVVALVYAALVRRGWLGFSMPDRLAKVSVASVSLPRICGGIVGLGFVVFATRPWWQTVRGATGPTAKFIAAQQRANDLPVDPSRWYSEWSLHWVGWWIGWAAIVLAGVAAVFLTARVVAGRGAVRWLPVLPVLLWSSAATLWLPSITPDHPWADRRLVPVVLPAMVLLACWGLSWMIRTYRRQAPRWFTRAIAGIGLLALVIPVGVATAPLIATPTQRGSVAAVHRLCRALGPDAAVVGVDRAVRVYAQAIRGMCDTPVARFHHPDPSKVRAAVAAIKESGRRPVLLAGSPKVLGRFTDAPSTHVVDLHTRQDAHRLMKRPTGTLPHQLTGWIAFP